MKGRDEPQTREEWREWAFTILGQDRDEDWPDADLMEDITSIVRASVERDALLRSGKPIA
jgi:hypothetical protein